MCLTYESVVPLDISLVSANAGIKSASASPLGWYRGRHCCGLLSASVQDDCLIISYFFWKGTYHGCLKMWFCQTGVVVPAQMSPAHYEEYVRQKLKTTYPESWPGRGEPIVWPSQSPNLNPMYFSCEYTWRCRFTYVSLPSVTKISLPSFRQCGSRRKVKSRRGFEKTLYCSLPSAFNP
jgi:hypothetical protein